MTNPPAAGAVDRGEANRTIGWWRWIELGLVAETLCYDAREFALRHCTIEIHAGSLCD